MIYAGYACSLFIIPTCQQCKKPELKAQGDSFVLAQPPSTIKQYKEIAIQYDEEITSAYNMLTPEERIFVYYFFRASLPGNRIAADQNHRYSLEIIDLFEKIFKAKDKLEVLDLQKINTKQFITDLETYLVYLWTNHGFYFQREHSDEKRTPNRLGLTTLTQENLIIIATALGIENATEKVTKLSSAIFDQSYEATATVPNSIEQSAINIYAPDFTEKDYQALPLDQRHKLNAYFYVELKDWHRIPRIIPYSTQAKYGSELTISTFWLKKALDHARGYPQHFDAHLIKSLEYLIQFLESSDEEFFKQHSIEWLKSSSRIDYNFGFIETYSDPKGYRGSFQAEATIKIFDITKLTTLLPSIEQQFPVPSAFKRESLENGSAAIPNASINQKIFGMGGLGPLNITAAYNLPNYEEIRSRYGSKQIIYPASKSLEMRLNPGLARKLFYRKQEAEWLTINDPEGHLDNDLWNVHCILHETVGHGSGKLATHTFKEGEQLSIGGQTYKVGDTIQVTHETVSELLEGYIHTIEELRAEIIALYVSINHLDELIQCNLLRKWPSLLTKPQLIEHFIVHMTRTSLKRLLQQNDHATEISGDHARANNTITNYLIERGGIEIVEEKIVIDNNEHTVIDIAIKDLEQAKQATKDLFILVQQIKSTGDGLEAKKLIETYGRPIKNLEHLKILKANRKTIIGDLKVSANLYPHFIPLYHKKKLIDIRAIWPKNIFEQYAWYEQQELSTDEPFKEEV